MKFNIPAIYGYGVADNSCVDECLSAIECDNDIFDRSKYDSTSFQAVYEVVSENVRNGCLNSCLALIGLVDFALKNQLNIKESHLKSYMIAKNHDPLSKYEERQLHIKSLDIQLSSYLTDQRMFLNDYCK